MFTELDPQISELIHRYLEGRVSLPVFEDSFLPCSWNIHQHGSPDTVEFVYEVELLLAELSRGDRTEEELRESLGSMTGATRIATPQVQIISEPQVHICQFGTASVSFILPLESPTIAEGDLYLDELRRMEIAIMHNQSGFLLESLELL